LSETRYILTLMEDAVFGGFPTDRTIMSPDPEMLSPRLLALHKPMLHRFNETVKTGREGLAAKDYAPVKVLYSHESVMLSEQSYLAVLGAEEILLRNHVPYGLLPVGAARPLAIPSDCEVLIVCDQRCLNDACIDSLIQFAQRGGRIVITGKTGEYDEHYRQRPSNILKKGVDGYINVVTRSDNYPVKIKDKGWTIRIAAPADGGRPLMDDLTGIWSPAVLIQAPSTVFAEVKRDKNVYYIHFLNYSGEPVAKGIRIGFSAIGKDHTESTFSAPMENLHVIQVKLKETGSGLKMIDLPPFSEYATVKICLNSL
jgi:hypothetical protein